jgi:predicted transcriptional regulator
MQIHEISVTPVKQKLLQLAQDLPDTASYEDVIEELYVMEKIERSLQEADKGNTISHAEVKEMVRSWFE